MLANPTLDEKIAALHTTIAAGRIKTNEHSDVLRVILADLEVLRPAPQSPTPVCNGSWDDTAALQAIVNVGSRPAALPDGGPSNPAPVIGPGGVVFNMPPTGPAYVSVAPLTAQQAFDAAKRAATPRHELIRQLDAAQSALADIVAESTRRAADAARLASELAESKAEVARLRKVLDTNSKMMHPWYGPCDGLGPDNQCAECLKELSRLRSPTATGEDADDQEWWLDLVEKDDRTSPEEYPDMAFITRDEFIAYRAAARAQGEREEREHIKRLIFTIRDKAARSIDWCNALNELQGALAPEPQPGSAQADASGEGGDAL